VVLHFRGSGGKGRSSPVGEVTDYRLGEPRFESRQGKEIFRFSKTSRPSPVPTHHLNYLIPGIKRPGLELDRSLPSDAEVKIECLYATPCICFHDVHRE